MKFQRLLLIFLGFVIKLSIVTSEGAKEYLSDNALRTDIKEDKKCSTTAGELIFILDSSTSVGLYNFKKEKEFAMKVINKLSIGFNLTRIAFITYNNISTMVFNLHQYFTVKEINHHLIKSEFTEGIAMVGDALNKVLIEIEPKSRVKVGKVIVLISDGKVNGEMDPYLIAQQLKSRNYTILTIGIENESDEVSMKAMSSNNFYYMIKNYNALYKLVSGIVSRACITFHTAKCPESEIKKETCINQKQTIYITAYYYLKGKCLPEIRKQDVNCLNPGECPKQYFSVAHCSKGFNKTHLLNVTYERLFGRCFQNIIKLKEVSCGCPTSIQEKTSVIFEKGCTNGTKSELILYNEFRQLTCKQSFFIISSVKCQETCVGRKLVSDSCINGTKTLKFYVKKFINNKCDLVLEKTSSSKCVTECPKSVKITSKLCINETRNVNLVTFENVNNKCVQRIKKLKTLNCIECRGTSFTNGKCIKGRQILIKVFYTKIGTQCKKNTVNVSLVKCEIKSNTEVCSKGYTLELSECVQGKASIIAKRQVKKENICVDESKIIAIIDCNGKCERRIKPSLFAGKCIKNVKRIFNIITKFRNKKCQNKIKYLGKMKCKDC